MDENEILPNEKLASLIVEQLKERDLIPSPHLAEIEEKLAAGRIKQDEWRLWIDLAAAKKEAGNE